ncbi:amidohydrolase [Myxococcota bacterium]|nr:amidohydrolase [Myxococcota bacterium]
MRDQRAVFDADGHVIEPPNVWTDHLDPALRSQVEPDVERLGPLFGALLPIVDGHPTFAGSDMMTEYLRSGEAARMQDERFGIDAERGIESRTLLAAMDTEGIDVSAVYPSYGLHVPYCQDLDATVATGLARAYNRWLGGLCAETSGRVIPVALAPLHAPELAAREIARSVREDGARAVMLRPNPIGGRPLHHPGNDQVFETLSDLNVAMIVHEGRGGNVRFLGEGRFDTWYASRAACHPMEAMAAFAGLVVEGVFDRFPKLRVGFLESGTGWLPYWLDRLDEHHELWGPSERPNLQHKPSEYFARQCVISGETEDKFLGQVVEWVGAERVMWASDFPHMECAYPDSVSTLLSSTSLAPDVLTRLLWDTPSRLYGVEERPALPEA